MTDLLDPAALTSLLKTLLPGQNKKLTSTHDGIAALVHTILSTLAFRLIALDDTSPPATYQNNVLPEDWNTRGLVDRTFRYRHDQSSLEFLIKIIKLGQRTLINAIALESDRASSLDISTDDFVSPSFYPHDLASQDEPPLVHGFISSNRIADFVSQFKLKIVQKLVPGLRKDGYTEVQESAESQRPEPSNAPRAQQPPARPETEIPPYQPPHGQPRNPLEIGRRDLDPLGGHANPFAPPPLFGPSGGDGMFVGPEHPIFGGRGELRGPWGGDGYLPPMGAPPGARFDPVGPLNPPFGGMPRRGPRPPGNFNDPDNDEFMPPGAGDMFM